MSRLGIMNMTSKVIATFLLFAFAGCSSELFEIEQQGVAITPTEIFNPTEAEAMESAMRYQMKDPDSSKFRNQRYFDLGDYNGEGRMIAVCGEVNGKNSYGGYTGYEDFYLRYNADSGTSEIFAVYDASDPDDIRAIMHSPACEAAKAGQAVSLRY